ncbi:hypothetical protein NIES4075_11340 [Tolypothrix sp. NIES-4075]|uniref:hypothetical protein n=1 Tax=Tolypothrix sp. NIES-4075 TaxID=2005459 RepID=UPI000B5C6447|nr:hypothetical protein [Tolypothrix sp. NIES-4075]GAX40172.1 hypothetical protein NIES4075_11340 [Tolypothrix sp. NIES-4075]
MGKLLDGSYRSIGLVLRIFGTDFRLVETRSPLAFPQVQRQLLTGNREQEKPMFKNDLLEIMMLFFFVALSLKKHLFFDARFKLSN